MDTVPTALWVVVGIAVAGMAAALVDLARNPVQHLPKWAWAAVIVLVSFPLGVLLYVALGRAPRERPPPADAVHGADRPSGSTTSDSADRLSGSTTSDSAGRAAPDGTTGTAPRAGRERDVDVARTDAAMRPAALVPPGTTTDGLPARRRAPDARTGSERRADATDRDAPGPDHERPDDPIISIRALRKVYGETVALDDVDLTVPRGSVYGLIGPNGAGKTTMLGVISGLRRPTAGTCTVAVQRRSMAVLADTPQFEPWLTASEVVDLARHLTAPQLPRARVAAALDEVGLSAAADRRAGGFSRGMLQRLGLACCLVGDPAVLLLDEPSSALDPAGRRQVLQLVGRLAHTRTVLLSTHILSDVQQVCDTVGVLDEGRVRFEGPLTELLARTGAVYDLHVEPPAAALAAALLAQPWVDDVREHAPGRLRVRVDDAVTAEREMAQVLSRHDGALRSFNPAVDLETAFLELTR